MIVAQWWWVPRRTCLLLGQLSRPSRSAFSLANLSGEPWMSSRKKGIEDAGHPHHEPANRCRSQHEGRCSHLPASSSTVVPVALISVSSMSTFSRKNSSEKNPLSSKWVLAEREERGPQPWPSRRGCGLDHQQQSTLAVVVGLRPGCDQRREGVCPADFAGAWAWPPKRTRWQCSGTARQRSVLTGRSTRLCGCTCSEKHDQDFKLEELSKYFHLQKGWQTAGHLPHLAEEAVPFLRDLRWPFRKLKSIQRTLAKVQNETNHPSVSAQFVAAGLACQAMSCCCHLWHRKLQKAAESENMTQELHMRGAGGQRVGTRAWRRRWGQDDTSAAGCAAAPRRAEGEESCVSAKCFRLGGVLS